MIKLIQSIIFFYGLSLQFAWASSQIDPEEFINHSCLIHASSVPPVNNVKYAGALRNYQVIPFDKAVRNRVTLHHCLGSLVPNDAMGGVTYMWGVPIATSMHQGKGHSISPYVFLTPVKKIVDRIYGGALNDLFVIDQIEYDRDTTIFINGVDDSYLSSFKEKNPDFQGKIITFNSDSDDIRALVNQEIKNQGFWLTTFNQLKNGTFQDVMVNDEHFTHESIEELFKKIGWTYVHNHNHHLFNFLEQFILPFSSPFVQAFHNPAGEFRSSPFLSKENIEVCKHAIDFLFEQLAQEASNQKSDLLQESLKNWKLSIDEWQRLYERLAHIHKNYNIKLKHAQLQPWIDSRDNPKELDKLEEEITTSALKRTYYYNEESEIGYEWRYFLAHQHKLLDTLCGYIQERVPAWDKRPGILSWFAITHLFNTKYSVDEAMENILTGYIHKIAEEAQGLKKEVFQCTRDEFWMYVTKDESEYASHSLSKIERLRLFPALTHILGEKDLKSVTALDFSNLLRIAPMTRILYGETESFEWGSFMKERFKEGAYPTKLQDAMTKSMAYCSAATQLSVPINPDNFVGLDETDGSHVLNSEKLAVLKSLLHPNNGIYKLIKDGEFGTLDEIFTKLGLHKEFRDRFPTDEDFWNVKKNEYEFMYPSFHSIYLELKG